VTVEKIVEKPVEVIVEKVVYVDRIVEKPIETVTVREVEVVREVPIEVIKVVEK